MKHSIVQPHHLVTHNEKVIPAYPMCRAVVDVVTSQGIDQHKLLRGTGIFDTDICHSGWVSANQLSALLSNVVKHSKSKGVGLQIGQALATSHYSGFAKALGYCRDLTQASTILSHYLLQVCPLVDFGVYRQPHGLLLTLRNSMGKSKGFPLAVDIVMAAFIALTKQWCGYRLPIHFYFPFSRPRQLAEYEMHLGRRLHFDQPCLSMAIDEQGQTTTFNQHNPFLLRASLHHYRQHWSQGSLLVHWVRVSIAQHPHLTVADTAEQLAMSPATLKRRLKEYQVTFTALVDEVRREQAIFLLQVCQLSNAQSAINMAIDDLTNFRRAVKRWTGRTPSELRQLNPLSLPIDK
ncbi:AraC family transcriptional regulator [Alteromonas sp. C1M14]|uniref:AraC family transcriptional regulator n=1 Tax=Alteromonas sp. C1M14 TaxID=2841567 RepID=UPI001C080F51|nr:AraC family transcriptional regulator [Alteromonas sp. C1M14]MBU2977912.1 AraC family transcriptional regulator [Alteromonas sp. C1M14]